MLDVHRVPILQVFPRTPPEKKRLRRSSLFFPGGKKEGTCSYICKTSPREYGVQGAPGGSSFSLPKQKEEAPWVNPGATFPESLMETATFISEKKKGGEKWSCLHRHLHSPASEGTAFYQPKKLELTHVRA